MDGPVEPATGGGFVSAASLAGHLLVVWPVGYVPHVQTRFTRPDKRSDAIVVDVVDLDEKDDDGYEGRLYQGSQWMQAVLIASLKPVIGKGYVVGRVGKGVARNGMNAPWVFASASQESEAMARVRVWLGSHPDFVPTVWGTGGGAAVPQPAQAPVPQPAAQVAAQVAPPGMAPAPARQVTPAEMEILERLRRSLPSQQPDQPPF